jgi:hypothetical protein
MKKISVEPSKKGYRDFLVLIIDDTTNEEDREWARNELSKLDSRIHPEIAPTCEQCGGQIQHAIFDFTFPPENGLCECEDVKEWE